MIQFGAKVAAEQLRKMGLSVRIDTRVVGRHEKSDRTVMTVNGDIEEAEILKVLKKNKVEYATVGSQVKDGKKSRMIRLVTPPIREGKEDLKKGAAVTKLMRDYKNAMAWVNAPKSEVPRHEIEYWKGQAQKLRAHALKQYGMNLGESVAEPFKRFKPGQIVTVIKTGKKVEVLSQNDIGLVQTVSTDPKDRTIKSWRDYTATQIKSNLFPKAGHQEYMPRELQESAAKPNMKGVEAELAAHADRKIAHEKKFGPMSAHDLHSHEVRRKDLLKKLSRERSKANVSEDLDEGWKMGAAAVALSGAVVAGIANSPNVEINGDTYAKAGSLRSAPADAKSTTVNINGKDTKVLYWEAYGPKNNRKMKVYAKVD